MVNDGIGITKINGVVSKESIVTYSKIYTLNNRKKSLPLDKLEIAVYEGIYYKISGIK